MDVIHPSVVKKHHAGSKFKYSPYGSAFAPQSRSLSNARALFATELAQFPSFILMVR
jgi:hypothetical protein